MQQSTTSNADKAAGPCKCEYCRRNFSAYCRSSIPEVNTALPPGITVSAQFSPNSATLTMSPEDLTILVKVARKLVAPAGEYVAWDDKLRVLNNVANVNIPGDSF